MGSRTEVLAGQRFHDKADEVTGGWWSDGVAGRAYMDVKVTHQLVATGKIHRRRNLFRGSSILNSTSLTSSRAEKP